MNPWIPQSPEYEASYEAFERRAKEYDRIAPRWRESSLQTRGRARMNHVSHALFTLNHDAKTATFIESVPNHGVYSAPFLGVTSHLEQIGDYLTSAEMIGLKLRLSGYPYNGDVLYRIIA